MDNKRPSSSWGPLAFVGVMGVTVGVPPVLGALAGGYLDGLIHTGHLLVLIGLLLGLIVGIFGTYRLFKDVLST
ncbi:MAG TPA: AtpZ/AtpI family protein [Ktedonobacteraceae bacterium]|jgi:hypothetical protein|nr:AtpZ/AtpI family protein [Ktedonobacteraceae bacterium]